MSAVPNLPEDIIPTMSSNLNYGPPKGSMSASTTPFQLHDSTIENFRPVKIIVIGAGYSGIYCGIRIPERIRNAELVIYEKNAGVGGTWWENRYPGCACDIPSHSYQFSFEPNHTWSSLYAPAPEIQAYLQRVATKYSADRFIKLSHEVKSCRWNERTSQWHVSVKNLNTGELIHDMAHVLISARGNLNNPAWPEIPGLEKFEGKVMHSAAWDESYDFSSKKIGAIGSGSSAIQIVPSLQRVADTHLTTFVRSKTWISPPFGSHLWSHHGLDGYSIPADIQAKFQSDPEYYQKFRLAVEEDGNAIHGVTIKGTPLQLGGKQMFTEHMRQRLETHPHIFDALLPTFSPGCRRLTPGPGYLEALTQPNVSFVTSPISGISQGAVHTEDGQAHEIDVLVCATGFHTSAPPPFEIVGQGGVTIRQKWAKRATTYLSHSVSEFPNLWMMMGPNAAIGSGSLTMMIENVGDYIVKCVRKLQRENIGSVVVKQEREDDFTEYVDAYFDRTVFMEECRSWYRNGKSGEVVGLWPGSTLHCIECMRSPRWEDYDYTYIGEHDDDERADTPTDEAGGLAIAAGRNSKKRARTEVEPVQKSKRVNRMAWLGSGWSVNEIEGRDLAWYLYPEFQDKPVAPHPEAKGRLKVRPFSY